MEILKEIKNRSTAKTFSGEPLEKDALDRILEAGRLAPSAKNRQPWRFIVVQKPERKAIIQKACYGEDRVMSSGAVISICTTNIDYKMPNGQLSYPIDLTFAASFMTLQAEHEGYGTSILTTFREQDIIDLLSVPYGMKVVMLLLIGQKSSEKTSYRLPSQRVLSFEHW